MLKITSILSSLLFLLFAVSGTYARTSSESFHQQESSKKDKQSKDKESEDEGKPVETAVQLDVFQAISLVNSQLRWKDFHAENSRNSRLLFSSRKIQSEKVLQSDEIVSLLDAQCAVVFPTAINNWILSTFSTDVKVVSSIQRSLTIQENTIAFILNSGTYPTQFS